MIDYLLGAIWLAKALIKAVCEKHDDKTANIRPEYNEYQPHVKNIGEFKSD